LSLFSLEFSIADEGELVLLIVRLAYLLVFQLSVPFLVYLLDKILFVGVFDELPLSLVLRFVKD
jgi:hypothetical protein